MKTKKLRGHNRIFKEIENWKNDCLELDLQQLSYYQRNYEKVWVRPFGEISITGATVPRPKRKARKLILEGLLEVFNSWELQLKTLDKPYYLAIWLNEPYIENSQVVCAIDEYLNFYDITYYRPEIQKEMPTQNYGKLKTDLDAFDWIYAIDEHNFTNEDLQETADVYASEKDYFAMQRWYKKQLKRNPIIQKDNDVIYYRTEKGTVWIGTKN
ncbi:MAG TPA: hypothetical protein DEA82_09265 [Flavobacteriaceae bacterium]|nr:hypothetical protein [Flavobacteriaceae bacterium]HBR54351.1 hypothetical protein [Flavobacteriaceae bacterium]|tara:strand:- start:46 stop:684 length:639 start_codon:yes stop_codon:yes gene_type:complete